ncbi:MAG: glycosyltransferase family 2 protein [Clostridium sp.]|nr:glycosyltransferase family 2 protein [Clostridium sp.]
MNKDISVILVNYNGKKYNDKCIVSILNSTLKERIQVVVVDNASTDDSLLELENHWRDNEQVFILPLNKNYGFSKANNEGIKWAIEQKSTYYLLLNNDTEIEADAIEKMLNCCRQAESIVVPKILYADKPDKVWCAGGAFSPVIKKPFQRGDGEVDSGQYDKDEKCDFANGCCMLLSKQIIEALGFLEEKFFLYYEDTEYSLRAGERGVPIRYCAGAKVYHKVNGSTGGNEKPANGYYITRNWLLCNKMHMKRSRFFLFCFYFLLNRLAWILIWGVQGKNSMVKAVFRGISDFRNNKFGAYIM